MNQVAESIEGDPPLNRPVVVGVGASAGGLEAIVQLLIQSSADANISYVVIQHLSPDHESALAEILGKRVKLPIHQVTESTKVLPNHVYVIPPGKYLSIKDCELQLSDPPDSRHARMAIDYFFRSLAEDSCEYGVGVILSGTGSDGSAGLQEIKHLGGLAVVQDPDEAAHRGMPQSAINVGAADMILPVREIATRLIRYVEHARRHGPLSAQAINAMEQVNIKSVLDILRRELKHDFRNYRHATLSRRISRRMGLQGMDQVRDYTALLEDSQEELRLLRDDLLIGVTRFFRDTDSWQMLQKKVIKPLVEKAEPNKPLRIWCPGCATGEEAYTMVMIILEQCALVDKPVSFQVFASDVAPDALAAAREGNYPDAIVADVSIERLRQFFQKTDQGYRVSKQLREHVVFAEQNVLAQAPFSNLDLISCRNMLIYLQREAQNSIFSVFQFALKEGGHLFLGSSESAERSADLFDTVNAKHRIFRRNATKSFPPVRVNDDTTLQLSEKALETIDKRQPSRIGHHVYRQLIREMEQGIVVINRDHRVLYLEGRADLYLQLSLGEVSTEIPDIFSIAREGIKSRLRTMIRKAYQSLESVEEMCRVKREGTYYPCRLKIRTLNANVGEDGPLVITFSPLAEHASPAPKLGFDASERSQDHGELRHELLTTREQLSTTIAQLETANEELKASNEEALTMNEQLQSGNEELETSKEELQSLNEELTTLNNQLELKLNELQHTTDDLNNLLTSASVPTIFLDTNLRIRRFTPSCKGLYNFIPSDVGRPLADIVQLHNDNDLISDAKTVLRDLSAMDKELVCDDQRCYIRRILPYRTEDDRIHGVVLTFADVSELASAKQELSRSLSQLRSIYNTAPVGLAFTDMDLRYISINETLAEINGFSAEEHLGKTVMDILPQSLSDEVSEIYRSVMETRDPVLNIEITGRTAACEKDRIWQVSYMAVTNDEDDVIGVNTVVQDVTDARTYQRQLRDSRDRLEVALSAGQMGTWSHDLQRKTVEWSEQMLALFGVNRDEFTAQPDSFINRVHPADRAKTRQAMDTNENSYRLECRILRDDNREAVWVESRAMIRRDKFGKLTSMTGVVQDITERHRHEESLKRAKNSAERANRSRGEFLANMSHEIRTPMTAILGYADMLAGHLKDPDNLQCVQTIRRNGRFLLEIIDDILDLSKTDSGKFDIQHDRIAPERIIADVVSLMNVRAEEKQVGLEIEFDGELPATIQTDPKRLRQILLNLVGNAIKFTDSGKVRIRVGYQGQQLRFDVIDTGIGIPQDKIPILFEAFTQADGSITRNFGGTGLGLAISARLAKMLGGKINVTSELNQGSTFTLTIDAGDVSDVKFAVPCIEEASSPPEQPDITLSGHFLIVDDRRDIRYLAQHFIESVGGTVSTASDGKEAIDVVQTAIDEERPFIAVCMDMQMPVMDGYAATRELRNRGIDVPVIALTANVMEGDQLGCRDAGCTAFVSKPISKSTLLSSLSKASGKTHSEIIRREN